MDAVFTAAAEWQAVDQRLTASQSALDAAITKMRQQLHTSSLTVSETPGAPAATVDDAIAALDRARQDLNRALAARTQALATLEQAQSASDVPLRQASDILLARRAIFAIVSLLLVLIVVMVLA